MLVPDSQSKVFLGSEDRTSTPGAVTSGFSWSDTGVGPADEKSAMWSGRVPSPTPIVEAAAVIAAGALPGESIDPRPALAKSLPGATSGTAAAAADVLMAFT